MLDSMGLDLGTIEGLTAHGMQASTTAYFLYLEVQKQAEVGQGTIDRRLTVAAWLCGAFAKRARIGAKFEGSYTPSIEAATRRTIASPPSSADPPWIPRPSYYVLVLLNYIAHDTYTEQ
ncbi:hypothetical protein BM1_06708 [Bipolaris maydis]|nr:hypothetical protein BM1_06708 [Bipolaris maydis]